MAQRRTGTPRKAASSSSDSSGADKGAEKTPAKSNPAFEKHTKGMHQVNPNAELYMVYEPGHWVVGKFSGTRMRHGEFDNFSMTLTEAHGEGFIAFGDESKTLREIPESEATTINVDLKTQPKILFDSMSPKRGDKIAFRIIERQEPRPGSKNKNPTWIAELYVDSEEALSGGDSDPLEFPPREDPRDRRRNGR